MYVHANIFYNLCYKVSSVKHIRQVVGFDIIKEIHKLNSFYKMFHFKKKKFIKCLIRKDYQFLINHV
jgi:hypothetical protein